MTRSANLAPCCQWPTPARRWISTSPPSAPSRPERLEGDVGVLQVARLGIGEADFWVQFDPGGNPHALGGSPPVRMILTVDDPDARRVQKS